MSEVDHRWSDDSWDWALSVYDDNLTPDEVDQRQRQLAPAPPQNDPLTLDRNRRLGQMLADAVDR
jgi:hypothetical protein